MEQLPSALLQVILGKMPAPNFASAVCGARVEAGGVPGEPVGVALQLRFPLLQGGKLDPSDRPCASWKATYESWTSSPLFQRSASLEELAEAESVLKCRFPPPARLLYRLCNGQKIPQAELDFYNEDQEEAQHVGLIGGYNSSHHYGNVHLLSLRQVMSLMNRILPPLTRFRRHTIIAASRNLNKLFFLDCEDGNVYVGTRNLLVDGEMMVCVPDRAGTASEEAQDGMLRWLEHYAH